MISLVFSLESISAGVPLISQRAKATTSVLNLHFWRDFDINFDINGSGLPVPRTTTCGPDDFLPYREILLRRRAFMRPERFSLSAIMITQALKDTINTH